jgi:outer membrane protein assembly factor BamE (lipoprotein component of BamABCDE complex)
MVKNLIVVSLACLGLAGCAISDNTTVGKGFDASQRVHIKKHVSTQSQVESLLGNPSDKFFNSKGEETWVYESGTANTHTSMWSGNANGTIKVSKLVVVFDTKGKVENYLYSNSTQPMSYKAPGLF